MKALRYFIAIAKLIFYCDFQNSWKWFIYYRTQNTNKPSHSEPAMKVAKTDVKMRHYYPDIPHCEDETSNQRNLELLKEENTKPKPSQEVMKALMGRTFSKRRSDILNLKYPNSLAILAEFPALKRSTYVSVFVYVAVTIIPQLLAIFINFCVCIY